ncbi:MULTISPECIES: hypothetical protein [Pseudomonas]|uniref:hypothetical protein n=2 Tax=Pseudomonas TaxID=286 RepID=UPI00146CECCD|nr:MULTISPECIES: hypothetical protein [Pseudomonas]
MSNVFILKQKLKRPIRFRRRFWLLALWKAKSRFNPKVEAAEAKAPEGSVHEQGDQDDDRDWHAEEKQQK